MRTFYSWALVTAASFALCACGGAGGGGPAAIATPPPAPTPAPTPAVSDTPPPLPPGPIAMTGGPFATYSYSTDNGHSSSGADQVSISYSPETNVYTLSAPGLTSGRLVDTYAMGGWSNSGWTSISGTVSKVTDGSSTATQDGVVVLNWVAPPYATPEFSYTGFGRWSATGGPNGAFVYGIPTTAADMPVTGSANYTGQVSGISSFAPEYIGGTIDLSFDFAKGLLSGDMKPTVAAEWEGSFHLPTYTFSNTVYSSGSTSFSGSFDVPGTTAPSSFSGSFNGPGATELMGSWTAPYLSPITNGWSTAYGIFFGKKVP